MTAATLDASTVRTPASPSGSSRGLVATAVALVFASGDALWVATHVHLSDEAHRWVLLAHLVALVIGFGAVLAVDWVGALWALGRRSLDDVVSVAGTLAVPIWGGYGLLVLSGILLEPDTTRTATIVKLGLALVIGLNGLAATALHHRLTRLPSRHVVAAGAVCAGVSQASWWGATVIGFVNAT